MSWEVFELDFSNSKEIPEELEKLLYWGGKDDRGATHNGIIIEDKDDLGTSSPIPWDVGLSIMGETLILGGGFGPGGYGYVEVRLPKKDAKEYYRFEIEVDDGELWERVKKELEDLGVVITHKGN